MTQRSRKKYAPVEAIESPEKLGSCSCSTETDEDVLLTTASTSLSDRLVAAENLNMNPVIDHSAVDELVNNIRELRRGLMILIFLFAVLGVVIAIDDYYTKNYIDVDVNDLNGRVFWTAHDQNVLPPFPRKLHKFQINASAFTANDFECLELDSGNWPSERVHCELVGSNNGLPIYDFVVEHFDDPHCQQKNADNPSVKHTSSGCFYFEAYNHSYHDLCHPNRTFTISAFYGPGCATPMPVTAVNLPPDGR